MKFRGIKIFLGFYFVFNLPALADNAPVVSWFEKPAPDSCLASPFLFRVQATDDVGIDSVYLRSSHSSSPMNFEVESGDIYRHEFTQKVTGPVNFSAFAIDINRNRSALPDPSVDLNIDNAFPLTTFMFPYEGYNSTGPFTVEVTASDAGCSSVDWIELDYLVSIRIGRRIVRVYGNRLSQILNELNLNDGENVVYVRAQDKLGNVSPWLARTFTYIKNSPPIINLKFEELNQERSWVYIDASPSYDPDGMPLNYSWRQLWGPQVEIVNPTSPRMEFRAPFANPGYDRELKFLLTISDGKLTTDQDVKIRVVDAGISNQAPVAMITGTTTLASYEAGFLDGAQSYDPEGDVLSFYWSSLEEIVMSERNSSNPIFMAPDVVSPKNVHFSLVVKDSFGVASSIPAQHAVQINPGSIIERPAVSLKSFIVPSEGQPLSLEINNPQSDLSYTWAQVVGPKIKLTGSDTPKIQFNLPFVIQSTELKIMVMATNAAGLSSLPHIVPINVEDTDRQNHKPCALPKQLGGAFIGQEIKLSGLDSYDPERSPLSYEWKQISGPFVHLYGKTDPVVRFYTSISVDPIEYGFELTVKDSDGQASSSLITVRALNTSVAPGFSISAYEYLPSEIVVVFASIAQLIDSFAMEMQLFFEHDNNFSWAYSIEGYSSSGVSSRLSYPWNISQVPNGVHRAFVRARMSDQRIFELVTDYTVQNSTANIPVINFVGPANQYLKGLQDIQFGVSGLVDQVNVLVNNNEIPVSVQGLTYSVQLDTKLYPRDLHVVITAIGPTGKTTLEKDFIVDNLVPSNIAIVQPNAGQELFGIYPFVVEVSDNEGVDRVEFIIDSNVLAEIKEPVINRYTFSLDTKNKGLLDGHHVFIARAFDKAGNQKSSSPVNFSINNLNPPVSQVNIVEVHPSHGSITNTDDQSAIFFTLSGDPDPTTVAQGVRVRQLNSPDQIPILLAGEVIYTNRKVMFVGNIPNNAEIEWDVNMKDTEGHVIGGVFKFYRAMSKLTGGDVIVKNDHAFFKVSVPPSSLAEDMHIFIEPMDMSSMPNGNYDSPFDTHVLDVFKVYGRNSVTSNEITHLNSPISIYYSETIPPSEAPEQARVIQIQQFNGNMWAGLNSFSQAENLPGIESSLRSASAQISQLSTFRIVSLAVPSPGISQFINYPNPFNPSRGPTRFQYLLGEESQVTLTLYDLFGNLVRKLDFPKGVQGGLLGLNTVEWDGFNGEGEMVGNGGYVAYIKANGASNDVVAKRKVAVVK